MISCVVFDGGVTAEPD